MAGSKHTNGRGLTAVVFLVGIIFGGGGSAFIGHVQYKDLEGKLDRLSDKVSVLGESVARIEGHLSIKVVGGVQ